MDKWIDSVLSILRNDGVFELIFRGYYAYLFPRLPGKSGNKQMLNGVLVRDTNAKLFDKLIGRRYYEEHEVDLLQKHARPGDTIIDVGAGLGVTTVHASKIAGDGGKVYAYEASERSVDKIHMAITDNPTNAEIEVIHGAVGEAKKVRYDEGTDAPIVDPSELPDCDVLMLDCEGAELPILREMSILPRVVIVETHAHLKSPASKVIEELENRGYRVVDKIDDYDTNLANLAAKSEQSGSYDNERI